LSIPLFAGFSSLYSQEAESNAVEFLLNNIPDTQPPVIRLLSPEIKTGTTYQTELEEIELIGEVTDESIIRFVSINTDIRVVNETGIFAKSIKLIPGENLIQIKAMDEHNNLQDQYITIEYQPLVVTLADRINRESKYFGLIIGIEKYNDPEIPDLENPLRDAQKVYNTLHRKYTFESENINFLKNPKRGDIIRGLDNLKDQVSPARQFAYFFMQDTGTGTKIRKIGYWLPSDATRESTVDWFRNSTLVDYLQAIHSKHTLLITDACFAGSIFKARSVSMTREVIYEKIYELPSRKAMTSGTMTEVPDESSFIKYLVQRLNENQETYLSAEELFGHMKNAVISNSNVLPQYGEIQNVGNEGGDFIFLKRK